MSCEWMKKERIGSLRPYRICLNPKVRMCKCWDENLCPLRHGGVRYRGKPGTEAFRWIEAPDDRQPSPVPEPVAEEEQDLFQF